MGGQNISGNSAAARQARVAWKKALDRQAAAADRGGEREQQEQQVWDEEVAKYGELEARRRRREEREWRKGALVDLPTSELDEMEIDD